MVHISKKSSSCSFIIIIVFGILFSLIGLYYIVSPKANYEILSHLTLGNLLNVNPVESTSSNVDDILAAKPTIRYRSSLTLNNILDAKHPELISPNGRFILRLESSGNLRYLEVLDLQTKIDSITNNVLSKTYLFEKTLFFTSTGDSWPGEHIVNLTANGVLQVRAKPTFMTEWKTTWTSSLSAQCKKSSIASNIPILVIQNSGSLAIYAHKNSSEKLCTLHREVIYQTNNMSTKITTGSKGKSPRLAIVIAGLFRTNTIACVSHVEKIIKKWQQKHDNLVDVFIFTYVQDAHLPGVPIVNKEAILAALKSCYKDNLKGAHVRNVAEIEEPFPGIPASAIGQCGPKLNRLQSQLKTVYLAGQIMRNYMLSEGFTYDYVLRLRPDTDAWGTIPDLPIFSAADNEATIYLPHPFREHYYWCAHHDGRIRTGITDQLAYGTLSSMQTYLNMYLEYADMVRIVTGHYTDAWKKAKHNIMGCEGTVGENGCDRPNADNCAIECTVSYYLVLHGLEPEILWTWQQNVLRVGGAHSKDCGRPFNC
ncbi:unnamed protein product [Adineta steineri]|uniref:Uncharacterized protein n=1 Tax=Adineta steineri TaxID=433720 RepID=A0A819BLY8_9BILA|nr:unnamed protein product [Adineta steineri]